MSTEISSASATLTDPAQGESVTTTDTYIYLPSLKHSLKKLHLMESPEPPEHEPSFEADEKLFQGNTKAATVLDRLHDKGIHLTQLAIAIDLRYQWVCSIILGP
jgi:hypothetical protein